MKPELQSLLGVTCFAVLIALVVFELGIITTHGEARQARRAQVDMVRILCHNTLGDDAVQTICRADGFDR